MEQNSLKSKTIKGLFWSFSDSIAYQGIQFLIQVFLARLLVPKDFGIIGMITVFIAISQTFIDSGFTNALIREKEPSQDDYSTAFFFNLFMAGVMYVVLFFSAGAISNFFKEPELVAIIRALAIVLIINSFGLIQRTMLTKSINFKTQTQISIISSVISGVIAIYFAYNGFGAWSLVIKTLSMQLIQSLLLCIFNKWIPSLVFRLDSFKRLFKFGWKLLVAGLINTIYNNLYFLIIGKVFSAVELGYYTNAQKLRDTASQSITSSVQNVSYPVLSSIKEDEEKLRATYKKIIKTSVFITFPLMIGLAVVANPLITLIFGQRWINSIPLFQILCLCGMLFPLHAINLDILQVKGRSDLLLVIEIVKKIIGLTSIAIVLFFKLSIIELLWVGLAISCISYLINSYFSAELLSYSTIQQIKDVTPAFIASILMAIVVYLSDVILPNNNLIKLLALSIIGVVVYVCICKIGKIEELNLGYELLGFALRKIKIKRTNRNYIKISQLGIRNKSLGGKKVKKIVIKVLEHIMRKKGYSSYFGLKLIKHILNDLFNNKQNTLREKIWAYKRGFLSPKIKAYGLTDNNYKYFLSDFDYCKLFPINGEFRQWIDDKLTTKYILHPFKEYLPKYYYHIKTGGVILPLIDGDSKYNVTDIIDLLKKEKHLALKLTSGSCGIGFYKLSYTDNDFFINSNIINENVMLEFLSNLENYLVTEYITSHTEIRKIYSYAPNTLRVMVINEDGRSPIIANAFMRFGTKNTGVVDNLSAGGIFAIVDINNGRYYDAKREVNNHVVRCEVHPDTNVKIEGVIPHYELIKTKIIEICRYLSVITYMGFDVVMTEDSFKILEINSHQGIIDYQDYYPLLINNGAASFFNRLLSKKVR